nr:MAG TPA: hypothetical protein [Caudoviricetes sp.]
MTCMYRLVMIKDLWMISRSCLDREVSTGRRVVLPW